MDANGNFVITWKSNDGSETGIYAQRFIFPLTVPETVENLIETVETMNLQAGIENSLDSKLQNIQDSIEALNADLRNDAINKLEAFINSVEAQRDQKISNEQADYLVAEAQKIIEMIMG